GFELAGDDLFGFAAVALGFGFANTDDDAEADGQRRFGLGLHVGIAFAMIGAAFAMADDDEAGAGVLEHGGRDIPGVSAAFCRVAILRTHPDQRRFLAGGVNQSE